METISNEQKAKELSKKYEEIVEYSVEQCLIEMAIWKDEQFEEMLNKLPESVKDLIKTLAL